MSTEPRTAFDALLAGQEAETTPPTHENITPHARYRWMILGAAASFTAGTILLIASVSAVSSTDAPERVPVVATPSREEGVTAEPSSAPSLLSQEKGSPQSLIDQTWVQEYAEITGIPARALCAYAGASLHVATEFPDCALGWNTLAGIGHVESHHGTIYGSTIDHDGVASPAIIGIPLTGETTQAIRDTDHGELDGDTVWDRAVGPMQFIPTTWAEWGTDGNGDGKADPQNIDDSALSAARYLCSIGGNLNEADRWIAAVHAYNPTVEYNNLVAEAAEHYGSF